MIHPSYLVQMGGVALFGAVLLAEKAMVRGWQFSLPQQIRR